MRDMRTPKRLDRHTGRASGSTVVVTPGSRVGSSPGAWGMAPRVPLSPPWGLGLDPHLRDPPLGEANLVGSRPREVEVPALHIGPPVINRHQDRLPRGQIGHFGLGPQRQRPMGGGQCVLIEGRATGRRAAVEPWPIPRGRADLNDRGWAGGSRLLVDRGAWRRRHWGVVLTTAREAPQPDETDAAPPRQQPVPERHDGFLPGCIRSGSKRYAKTRTGGGAPLLRRQAARVEERLPPEACGGRSQ